MEPHSIHTSLCYSTQFTQVAGAKARVCWQMGDRPRSNEILSRSILKQIFHISKRFHPRVNCHLGNALSGLLASVPTQWSPIPFIPPFGRTQFTQVAGAKARVCWQMGDRSRLMRFCQDLFLRKFSTSASDSIRVSIVTSEMRCLYQVSKTQKLRR
ncbi:hypothetical protein CDAR_504991 [Caerostris darwini]|uniref:Uncharacterized protein n=1 Tax=Caerostris darwini TaxID=1538125 RepID=A0AAV4MPF2_9ARAC|nr:hypothetical protein CDAR_504991 [Caerostris darwini]